MATQTVTSDRHKTVVLYSVLSVAFVLLVVMGYMVGDLWMRLTTLQVTVEEINTRKMESVKLKLEYLAVNVDNITTHNEELDARLDQLADKVDRLQLQKEGQLHYVMVAQVWLILIYLQQTLLSQISTFQVTPLQPDVQLMLFLSVCSWLTPTSYYNLVL